MNAGVKGYLLGAVGIALLSGAACSAAPPTSAPDAGSNQTTTTGSGQGDGADGTTGGSIDITSGTNSGSGGSSAGNGDGDNELPGEEELPEEVEDPRDYRIPVATGRYLWSTNPQSGRVALIDAVGLSVQVLSAGLYPTFLAPIPGNEDAPSAIVINVGSSDATRFIVRDGEVSQDSVDVHPGANRWTTSEHWAVAWTASEGGGNLDPTDGLQEITVISVDEESLQEKRLAVGYRPRLVQISSDETYLTVVAADGITIVELDKDPGADNFIDLGLDSELLDVSLSRDGNYALVRKVDGTTVQIINLRDPSDVAELEFSGPVTDVDLAPTGRVVVAVRQTREIATFLLDEVLEDPSLVDVTTLEDQIFGSTVVTDDGKVAIAYTNAVENDTVNVVQLEPGDDYLSYRQLSTQSPVYSVVAAPGGDHAVVLAGNGAGAAANAFALISLKEARFPRIVGTGAKVQKVAIADTFALVTAAASAPVTTASAPNHVFEAHAVQLPELTVRTVKLASEPQSVGALPDFDLGYVAQTHAEGRVTFFDFENNDVSTLTGFELSAEVVDE